MGIVEQIIHDKLVQAFSPAQLQLANESHMHSVPPGSESHFKVVLVSEAFAGKRLVQRHQAVYTVLAEELKGAVHALALHTYTPEEWSEKGVAPASPNCMGGSKADY